ncbi:Outer membrane protein assembly factor BamB precursor [Rubripirellula lacrimiformis]|uniref:Outer membrane protein assembly factor BamB n=1 Tax=Rubripirellula lacrimiformis TaxID=1930273 RepID=A0A517NKD5_9BACT|nr:PQQ-binding-like beta-propeller repeat protein [Rubripirellula lacrimiformis]QDT07604.1 Outer membrane protein assembly factor BamB precursor [Rubripirellula lacrimiformis]
MLSVTDVIVDSTRLGAATTPADPRWSRIRSPWMLGLAIGSLMFFSTIGSASDVSTPAASGWPMPRGDSESTGATKMDVPDDLQVRWEFKADEAIEVTPVVAGGRVFFGDVMGKMYAIDQATGKEIWSHNYDTGFIASPAVHQTGSADPNGKGDVVVVGDIDGNLYAIDAATGKERWTQTTEGEINGSAAFHDGHVLVTSQDGKLYCFELADGKPVWTYTTDDQIRCSPTIAGDLTFLGGCDGRLHMVDLKTGKAAREPLPLDGPTGSTPAVRGSKAFLPIMDGAVFAFDWKSAKQLWRYEDDDFPQEYRSSAAVGDQLVILSSQRKQIDAVSIETGKRVWRHTLRRRADASPVIAGDDVFIAATDGRLVRLSLADGTDEKWSYEIRGSFLAAPAIADHMLFIADEDGVVRCFAGKTEAATAK